MSLSGIGSTPHFYQPLQKSSTQITPKFGDPEDYIPGDSFDLQNPPSQSNLEGIAGRVDLQIRELELESEIQALLANKK